VRVVEKGGFYISFIKGMDGRSREGKEGRRADSFVI